MNRSFKSRKALTNKATNAADLRCQISTSGGMQMKQICWVLRTVCHITLDQIEFQQKREKPNISRKLAAFGKTHQLKQNFPSGCKPPSTTVITLQGTTEGQLWIKFLSTWFSHASASAEVCGMLWRTRLYLVFWGVAYLKRKWDIWEGCWSLVTPGGDSGSSPHLKHTESAHTDDGG